MEAAKAGQGQRRSRRQLTPVDSRGRPIPLLPKPAPPPTGTCRFTTPRPDPTTQKTTQKRPKKNKAKYAEKQVTAPQNDSKCHPNESQSPAIAERLAQCVPPAGGSCR